MAWQLYYDGGCNLCHTSQLRIEKWAERAGQPLDVDVLLSDEAIAKGYGGEMVLEAGGKVYRAADAWLFVMRIAPWYFRWVAWFGLSQPSKWLATKFYNVIARYRLKWFGTRACQISNRPEANRPDAPAEAEAAIPNIEPVVIARPTEDVSQPGAGKPR